MENKIVIIWAVAMFFALLVYRLLNRPDQEFEKELNHVLTSDQYKVKGKFE